THNITLNVPFGEKILYDLIDTPKTIYNITCKCKINDNIVLNPNIMYPIYVDVGYTIVNNGVSMTVVKGKGLYQYTENLNNDEGLLSELETSNTVINVDFCQMGIGGLKLQMDKLMRQVLVSRLISPE